VDVLAIILACSLHPDDALVRALVDVQSSGNTFFVGDLATLKTNDGLASADAALRYAEDLARHGGRPAVGLLGVPLSWAARYGRSPIELFDGCTDVAIATAAFAEYQARCAPARLRAPRDRVRVPRSPRRPRPPDVAIYRACVLSRFASDLGLTATPEALLRRLAATAGSSSDHGGDAPCERSLLFVDSADDERREAQRRPKSHIFLDTPSPSPSAR